ncbi:hypothetical protein JCM17960_35010 [Magnetospira thiophila]
MRNVLLVLLLLLLAVVGLGGCAVTPQVEMPTNEGSGADEMRQSPCACLPLQFDGRGFKWMS